MITLPEPAVFEWDRGNSAKNLAKHDVTNEECEEIFFDDGKKILQDPLHSRDGEERHVLIGKTKGSRLLFAVFTVREGSIRVISARDLNRREMPLYEG